MSDAFTPAPDAQLADHRAAVSRLLRDSDGRDLTDAEIVALLPGHAPQGHYQNRVRGALLAALNRAGFTWHGKRLF